MKASLDAIVGWMEHRTGIRTVVQKFLYEEIPASSGWRQVFGSVALFLFLVQFFTGLMLAINYAPTPGDAYNSLRYILTELTGGRLIRGLHHWGASMLVVIVVLHMVQVFIYGAYKKPREVTWIVGVALFLLTLAYALTGYLLPWDNRAYWGTVVATQIAGQAPVLGPYLSRLLGGAGQVGVVTFARFYGLHVLLLPPTTLLLIGLHVFLVRKHGVAPVPGDEVLPKKPFYPGQVMKDTLAIFIAFAVLFTLAVAARVPLEQLADPSDTSYIPRPEWYFLFLFQSLKLFPGSLEVLASVGLPTVTILALILVPFIDRRRMIRVTRRTVAFGAVALAALAWTGLTASAILTTPADSAGASVDYSVPTDWIGLTAEEMAGVSYFRQENCSSCHTLGEGGTKSGPDLTRVSQHRNAGWMLDHFRQPAILRPGTSMPPVPLSTAQLNSLAAFLLKVNPRNAGALRQAPDFAVRGASVYQDQHCGTCHSVNGAGGKLGPPMNGLARRRSRSWVEQHFADPRKFEPQSMMPPYKLPPSDMRNLTAYLFGLPE
jgi:ubiquinol-cytochrome c reductase cytochrome b subunit